jgi:hypothetical protein
MPIDLRLLAGSFVVARYPRDAAAALSAAVAAASLRASTFASLSVTRDEISLACLASDAPAGWQACERDFRALVVPGPLDFALTGILAALTAPLREAGISVFAVSTFDTDYLLVRAPQLDAAVAAWRGAGIAVQVDDASS